MEVMATTGKKLSKFIGLYGAPEAIAASAGALYCCCNSGVICAWGTRYLGDVGPSFDADDTMVWGSDARLTADVLSPTLVMRHPITDFVGKKQHKVAYEEPYNLKDNLRRYLGVAPKKGHTKRPNPILPAAASGASNVGPLVTSALADTASSKLTETRSPTSKPSSEPSDSVKESLERSKHIRQVWLGPMHTHLASSRRQGTSGPSTPTRHDATPTRHDATIDQPPKLLRASDFVAACSTFLQHPSTVATHKATPAESALSFHNADLTAIPTIQTTMAPISFPHFSSPSVVMPMQAFPLFGAAPPADSGEFRAFNRAKEYLLSRKIVPANNGDFGPQDVFKALAARSLPHHPVHTQFRSSSVTSGLADPAATSFTDQQGQQHKCTDTGNGSGVTAEESFITWTHISHAWGAKPKRGDETKLAPKPQ